MGSADQLINRGHSVLSLLFFQSKKSFRFFLIRRHNVLCFCGACNEKKCNIFKTTFRPNVPVVQDWLVFSRQISAWLFWKWNYEMLPARVHPVDAIAMVTLCSRWLDIINDSGVRVQTHELDDVQLFSPGFDLIWKCHDHDRNCQKKKWHLLLW